MNLLEEKQALQAKFVQFKNDPSNKDVQVARSANYFSVKSVDWASLEGQIIPAGAKGLNPRKARYKDQSGQRQQRLTCDYILMGGKTLPCSNVFGLHYADTPSWHLGADIHSRGTCNHPQHIEPTDPWGNGEIEVAMFTVPMKIVNVTKVTGYAPQFGEGNYVEGQGFKCSDTATEFYKFDLVPASAAEIAAAGLE